MAKKNEQNTFDQSLKKLEEVVKRLETGELTLEDSIELYQEGMELARQCHVKLEAAEQKVQQIVRENDQLRIEPFHSKEGESV